ncbi:histidine phosphatase family protein [Alicyclobacillus sp. SO9]|uniref:histidine phosphatase family protein n=1 Tax=Alicyclobacillus sp. SO9 TaxID=2665646 RepID=UPI0018E8E06D|nr:histidine phosphatase family protein [Alicyclobacillus sp. SO9]QQE79680.1 histidine phosphatase family protein [Alicyclobacillus sp. SO9]
MNIHILRHGETNWNVEGRIQGQQNIGLNNTGRRQIEAFCHYVIAKKVDDRHGNRSSFRYTIVLTSSLRRAYESAEICSQRLELPMKIIPEFAERCFGPLEGMKKETLVKEFGIEDVEAIEDRFHIESQQRFLNRLNGGLRRIKVAYGKDHVLLVSHGSVIRTLGLHNLMDNMENLTIQQPVNQEIIPNGHVVQLENF